MAQRTYLATAEGSSLYTPLSSEPGSFRLVRLLPSDDLASPVLCELYTSSLTYEPLFEAVSYVWRVGYPDPDPIILNNQPFLVGLSLKGVLQRIRHLSEGERILWIDAISINQDDLAERAAQVQQMRRIYKSAKRVLVCLDDDDTHNHACTKVVPLLKKFSEIQDLISSLGSEDESSTLDQVTAKIWTIQPDYEVWTAVALLFKSPWFDRTWTVQEIAVAREALVMYGIKTIDWELLVKATRLICDVYDHLEAYPPLSRTIDSGVLLRDGATYISEDQQLHIMVVNVLLPKRLISLRKRTTEQEPTDLLSLLIETWDREATDPRDKVFALLGLLSTSDEARPEVDYEKPFTHIFAEATKKLIRGRQGLNVLTLVKNANARHLALPSWCPDWRLCDRFDIAERMWILGNQNYENWNAGGHNRDLGDVEDVEVLALKGLLIDKINNVHSVNQEWETILSTVAEAGGGIDAGHEVMLREVTEAIALHRNQRAFIEVISLGALDMNANQEGDITAEASIRLRHTEAYPTATEVESGRPDIVNAIGDLMEFLRASKGRQIIWSEYIELGLAPAETRKGDFVCVFFGGKTPFVVRRVEERRHWILIGPCYVSGVMHGEALRAFEERKHQAIPFVIR